MSFDEDNGQLYEMIPRLLCEIKLEEQADLYRRRIDKLEVQRNEEYQERLRLKEEIEKQTRFFGVVCFIGFFSFLCSPDTWLISPISFFLWLLWGFFFGPEYDDLNL